MIMHKITEYKLNSLQLYKEQKEKLFRAQTQFLLFINYKLLSLKENNEVISVLNIYNTNIVI